MKIKILTFINKKKKSLKLYFFFGCKFFFLIFLVRKIISIGYKQLQQPKKERKKKFKV